MWQRRNSPSKHPGIHSFSHTPCGRQNFPCMAFASMEHTCNSSCFHIQVAPHHRIQIQTQQKTSAGTTKTTTPPVLRTIRPSVHPNPDCHDNSTGLAPYLLGRQKLLRGLLGLGNPGVFGNLGGLFSLLGSDLDTGFGTGHSIRLSARLGPFLVRLDHVGCGSACPPVRIGHEQLIELFSHKMGSRVSRGQQQNKTIQAMGRTSGAQVHRP